MSIAPIVGGDGGGAADPAGEWFVDAGAAPGGDGSSGAPFSNLQDALNAAHGTAIEVLNVAPGTYPTDWQGGARAISDGFFELDNIVVRSTAGKESTFLTDGAGLFNLVVVMRENALLEGFTITPDEGGTCLSWADSGGGPPPHPLFGSHSVVRDVTFDAEPLSPLLAGACFTTTSQTNGSTDNVLENFEVKGEWDSGIGFHQVDGNNDSTLYVRDGIIDPACRFDFSVLWVGSGFGTGGTAHLYIENVHVPAEVTVTDDAFVAAGDGVLHLSNVSVDGAGARGLSADHYAFASNGDGVILGDGIRIVNSVGDDLELAATSDAVMDVTGYTDGGRTKQTIATTGLVSLNGAGPWVAMLGDLTANWDDAANQGWGTEPFAYRLHSDRTVEWRGGVAATSAAALTGFLVPPAPAAPVGAITIWWSAAAWEGGGANTAAAVISLGSGGAQVEQHSASPNVDNGDVYFFDGFRYAVP